MITVEKSELYRVVFIAPLYTNVRMRSGEDREMVRFSGSDKSTATDRLFERIFAWGMTCRM